jgi:protein-L-isoaspartate(D-aspartate) O-methyltransferase
VLELVPRELFVDREQIGESAEDRALPLTEDGASTISALHAYVASFSALELESGDQLVDLGGGSGYGAALASEVVGAEGGVLSLELEPLLAARARRLLADRNNVRALHASAHDVELWRGARKVSCGFALERVPAAWLEALADGGRLVAPIGDSDRQTLTLFEKVDGAIREQKLGLVRYVADRAAHPPSLAPASAEPAPEA